MIRHTLISAAIILSTGAAQVQAGPGCMNNRQATGWYPQQAMPGPMNRGYSQMPGYAGPQRGMAMSQYPARPQFSPMMTGARQQGYWQPSPSLHMHQPAADRVSTDTASPQTAGENVTVRIKGMRFEPAVVRVKPGTTVTWIQDDGAPHTVTGNKGELASATMTGGQRFTHTFGAAGSYDYACNFHPMMKGQVVVEDSAS